MEYTVFRWRQWLMPLIPATQEVEIRVKTSPGKKLARQARHLDAHL
jgi:hypothetical protein